MPIYHDGFESYALGAQTAPFGAFTTNPFLAPVQIAADNYLPAGTQALVTRANFANCSFSQSALYSSATLYAAIKFNDTWNNATFLKFWNGSPHAVSGSHPLFTLGVNFDATISAYAPNATLISVPCGVTTAGIHSHSWYFLQVNLVLTNAAGFVQVDFEVAIDKVTVLSGSVSTGVPITALTSGTAQFDYIQLDNSFTWDEFTFDVLQTIGTFPNAATPKAKVSTGLAEVVESTTSANAVFSTGLIELIISGEDSVYEA